MLKQAVVLGTVAVLGLAASGCGVFHAMYYEPYGPGLGPSLAHCGHRLERWSSAGACDPACESGVCPAHQADSCGACDGYGGPWGPADCGPYTDGHCGPLTLVFALFRHHCFWGTGSGGRYYGEWLTDPTDGCDPCDFAAPGVPYEGSAVPAQPAPCLECQGAAPERQAGGTVARVSPSPGSTALRSRGRPAARTEGYSSRQASRSRSGQGFPSRGDYGQRLMPQAARPQTAPASYAY